MRPIDLVPDHLKRRYERSDTGALPYAVVAVLVTIVLALLAYVLTANQEASKRRQLATLNMQVRRTSSQLAVLSRYGKFAALKSARLEGLTLVARSRFPWARVMTQTAKALPADVSLVELKAVVAKGAKTGESGASSSASSAGSSAEGVDVPGPTLRLTGCTFRQQSVARMMSRLRNIDGIAQVLLTSSDELKQLSQQGDQSSNNTDECRTRPKMHKFVVTVTFPIAAATRLLSTISGQATPSTAPASAAGTGASTSASGTSSSGPPQKGGSAQGSSP